jgi:hypothetical protein
MNSEPTREQLDTGSPTEETVTIEALDPARELPEGIPPAIRSCKSCIHAKVCKVFEVQAIHVGRINELSKRAGITIDILPPEQIGSRCSEYSSGVTK